EHPVECDDQGTKLPGNARIVEALQLVPRVGLGLLAQAPKGLQAEVDCSPDYQQRQIELGKIDQQLAEQHDALGLIAPLACLGEDHGHRTAGATALAAHQTHCAASVDRIG